MAAKNARVFALTLLLIAPALQARAVTCSGSDPQIVGLSAKSEGASGSLVRFLITGSVVNRGAAAQASNLLQSVVIYDADDKLDTKSIPPLKPGQSFTFSYDSTRSAEAGAGSTILRFKLDPISPCSVGDDVRTVTF
jgi:hypothetical protein